MRFSKKLRKTLDNVAEEAAEEILCAALRYSVDWLIAVFFQGY
jgi:hypothetical protein